ncbi:MAG: Holliday junction branch migration protein RuvA [Gammaproteobacteria bacterium]
MIGRLRGQIAQISPQQLLIDVGGVGYEVEISLNTFAALADVKSEAVVFTHLVVREDAQLLFGFSSADERELFRTLIKVNGVGPKMALAILSGLDASSFAACILDGDVKTLTGLPGVGKKTAERLIIEMRDKVTTLAGEHRPEIDAVTANIADDAEAALIGLGYRPQEAALALSKLEDPGQDLEALIKQALKILMKA